MAEHFSGRVHTIVFENSSQNYYVVKIVLDDGNSFPVTAKGTIIGLPVAVGSWIPFEGEWVVHPEYGRQLSITKAPSVRKWDAKSAASILITYGLTKTYADKIEQGLGDHLVHVLDNRDVETLAKFVDEKTAGYVISRWMVARSFMQTMQFLHDAGVPKAKTAKVWSVFGDRASEVLSSNPWALVQIDGISFQQADDVAIRLGLDLSSICRVEGAVLFAVRDRRGMGHLYLRSAEIFDAVQPLLDGAPAEKIAQAIKNLAAGGHLIVDKSTRPGIACIYDPWMHRLESQSANLLMERAKTAVDSKLVEKFRQSLGDASLPDDPIVCASAALDRWSKGSHITLSPAQHAGALKALTQPVSVLTGLPGTGKTTSLRAVVQISRDLGLNCLLIAPTGIAAKRMASVTGMPASTIHRAFAAKGWAEGQESRSATYVGVQGGAEGRSGSDGSGEEWASPDRNDSDVLFVDEASMMDQHLLYRILTCTPPKTRLVFIGDAAQLPSVGPGNVLRDLVASQVFPTTALTEIYRQADTSAIVLAAHAINSGHPPELREKSEFAFVSLQNESEVLDRVLRFAKQLHDRKMEFQVMSPRHAGLTGVTNLNATLREMLNPKTYGIHEIRLGSEVLRDGDKVMVVRNNYNLGVFNGDVGHVTRIDKAASEVEVEISGPIPVRVRIPLKEAVDLLRLGYAVTVHKMQGQESGTILMPWINGFSHQLQRNLLYTAITRARSKAILVGQWSAVMSAVVNDQTEVRNTLFKDRLLAPVE